MFQEGAGIRVAGNELKGLRGAVFGSGRNALSGLEEDGFGLTIDPVELEMRGAGLEACLDGDHRSGGYLKNVSSGNAGEGDAFTVAVRFNTEGCGHVAFARPELAAVAVEKTEMDIST